MAHGQAIDSLLNYETVKYFNNEEHIAGRYDRSLAEVERLTVKALAFRSTTGVSWSPSWPPAWPPSFSSPPAASPPAP